MVVVATCTLAVVGIIFFYKLFCWGRDVPQSSPDRTKFGVCLLYGLKKNDRG